MKLNAEVPKPLNLMGLAIQTSEFKMRKKWLSLAAMGAVICDTSANVPGHFCAQSAHFLPELDSLVATV
jgi:hypothetical protein